MQEDIDEVLLRLTNQSIMQDKSNAKLNLISTNQVLDLESENDDCFTSVSQCPVNPLSVLGTSTSNTLSLPTVKMVTYERFWQEQDKHEVNNITEDVTEQSSSVGTFSGESKKKDPVIFSEWCPVLNNKELQIDGVTINGNFDIRSIGRRVSGYIFYDKSEVPCSLGGPMTCSESLPNFIQLRFSMGIPEDWVAIRSIWNEFQKLGSPESFAWLPSTDLDTETSDVLVRTSKKPALSTPRNNTIDFFNMTTEISKIDTADVFRNDRQKSFKHTVNSVADRSVKKTYTSAELKRKMRKYQAMLKVTLMRERSTITSFQGLSELQENELELGADSIDVSVDKVVPQQTTITRGNKTEHLLQNKQPQHLVIKNRSKNDINMSVTSQSKDIELSRSENALHNGIGSNINNVDSFKTPSNVFLNKSQFVTKNKSNNAIKNLSSFSENSAVNKLLIAYKNKTTSANLSPKIRENISPRVISSETSELSASNQSQLSKSNSSDKNKLKHRSAVSKLSVNTSKKITPTKTSSEELRNVLVKKFPEHRDSVSLVLDKNYSELVTNESVSSSSNSYVIDDIDSYLANINSVVFSYHDIYPINDTSEICATQTAKSISIRDENVSRPSKNTEKTSSKNVSSINKVVRPEEHHSESSSEDSIFTRPPPLNESSDNDSIFSLKYKKSENKGKQNVVMSDLSKRANNQDLNQTVQNVMSGSESSDINKVVRPEEHHSESSSEDSIFTRPPPLNESSDNDSIFSLKYKKSESKGKQNVVMSNLSKRANNQDLNQTVQNVMSGSESSDDDNDQNSNQINKTATTNVEIPNADKNLNQIHEEKINSLNSETSDDEGLIQVNKLPESSNKMNSFLSESSDSEDAEDSHVIITTNAIVHSVVKASVKNGQVPVHKSSSINKSGRKVNRKAIDEKSNKKRNNDVKDTVQDRISVTSNLTMDRDVSLSSTTISRSGRARCVALPFWMGTRLVTRGDETIITNTSALNSSFKIVDKQTSAAESGRAECLTLPFWRGTKNADETIITNTSALNSSSKIVEKRFLTPEKQTSAAKRARTKTPQKSPVKELNTEPNLPASSSSYSSSNALEQQNKNIVNVQAKTPKNVQIPQRQTRSSSKDKIEKSPVKTTKKINTVISSGSSKDIVDDVQKKTSKIERRLRSTSKKREKFLIENINNVSSSDIDGKIQTSGRNKNTPTNKSIHKNQTETSDNMINSADNSQSKFNTDVITEVQNSEPYASPVSTRSNQNQLKRSQSVSKKNVKKLLLNNENINDKIIGTDSTNYGIKDMSTEYSEKVNGIHKENLKTQTSSKSNVKEDKIIHFKSSKSKSARQLNISEINNDDLDRLRHLESVIADLTAKCHNNTLQINSQNEGIVDKKSNKTFQILNNTEPKLILENMKINENVKYSPKKTAIFNKFGENSTNTLDENTNISFVQENGKHQLSPSKSPKSKDIYPNFPLENGKNKFEADTNIQILDNVNFTPVKSQKITKLNKKFKSSSQEIVESGVESNNKYEHIECESKSTDKHNAQVRDKTTLGMAATNTVKDNDKPVVEVRKKNIQSNKLESDIIKNKDIDEDQSISPKKRNAKTKTEKHKTRKENIENTILNTNHSVDTSTSNLTKPKVKRARKKKTEENVEEVKKKQINTSVLRLRSSVSKTNSVMQSFSDTASNLSYLNTTVSSRGRIRTPTFPFWIAKSPAITAASNSKNNPNSLDSVISTSDIDSVLSQSTNQKRSRKQKSKVNEYRNSSAERGIFANSDIDKRKISKNKNNTSHEFGISSSSKNTQDKNLTSRDTESISSRLKRRCQDMSPTEISSESATPETSEHKTKTVAKCYDEYVNKQCIVIIPQLSSAEIKKYTEKKSTEPRVQGIMNDKQCKPVNETVSDNKPRTSEKNISSASTKVKATSSTKKRKSLMDLYFGDPVKMPLLIKLKRKRIPKDEQLFDTTNSTTSTRTSIYVNQKTGKRKFFNNEEWLNSKECRESVGAIDNEPGRSQNFCIQIEQNNLQHDYFDDDVISEVSAFATS